MFMDRSVDAYLLRRLETEVFRTYYTDLALVEELKLLFAAHHGGN